MHTIKNIERFNLNELRNNVSKEGSWHSDVSKPGFSMTAPMCSLEASITA